YPEIIKVFGEAFSKKLQKTPPFSIERRHPKNFLFYPRVVFKQSLEKTVVSVTAVLLFQTVFYRDVFSPAFIFWRPEGPLPPLPPLPPLGTGAPTCRVTGWICAVPRFRMAKQGWGCSPRGVWGVTEKETACCRFCIRCSGSVGPRWGITPVFVAGSFCNSTNTVKTVP
ncbi:hypothetical protein, partial [Novacetimonas hansenii]|uniref:hypothetical protein n=1 Tax=Novacetimonas hansenii TaxID=436 RepID=UPI0039E81FA2